MLRDFFSFDRMTTKLYILIMIIGLAMVIVVKYTPLFKYERQIIITHPKDAKRVIDIIGVDTLHINTATVSQMKYFGFKSWEINEICMYREAGCIFNSLQDLTSMRGFDSLRIATLCQNVSYDTIFVANNRYDKYFWKYLSKNKNNKKNKNYTYNKPDSKHLANKKFNSTEKTILFKADSAELINKGIDIAVWDTISFYKRIYILTGSILTDSLLSATADNISKILRPKIKGTRYAKIERKERNLLEINLATIKDLQKLYGIKEKLATIIINRRDNLGGFVDLRQLKEISVLKDSSSFNRIAKQLSLDPTRVKPISINKWTEKQLKKHPYIDSDFAFRIYKRRIKKTFKSIEEVRELYTEGVDYTYFEKYLSFEE